MEIWKPNVIFVGPGGSRGFLYIGCIKRLIEENFLNKVNTWVGCSVGAAISLLIVAGYDINEIKDLCMNINIVEDIININLNDVKEKLGFIQNKTVEEELKRRILSKFDFIPTLKQLYTLTGLTLSLVTFNMDDLKPEYLDKDTSPDLSCVEAAMMSMAIPILMQPRKYKGNVYCDGGIGAPYPVLDFDYNGNKVLGMYISSEGDFHSSDKIITNFLYRLIHSSMKVIRDIHIEKASLNVKHIVLKTLLKDTTGLSINKESREDMTKQGYNSADSFLKINSNPEKYQIKLKENEEIPFEN
jgi:predicted acylesterase/phospholipase RssA